MGRLERIWTIGLLVLGLGLAPIGCATQETTVETTRTVRSGPPGMEGGTVVHEETTVVEKKQVDGCDGVLSCTVDFTGEVIAFPFRLVGGLLQVIF